MDRLHPGVYIEEVPSGVRPIEGVSTSTAAFIGKAEKGSLNKAELVTSFQEFQSEFGSFLLDSCLAHSVLQFFNNGGKKCYIVRVAGDGAQTAEIAIKDRNDEPQKTLTIKAANEGTWGNNLDIVITDDSDDPDNEFAIQVYKERSDMVPPLPPLLLETHDNLSMNPDTKNYVEKIISSNSKYINVTVDEDNFNNAKEGTSRSGILPIGNGTKLLKFDQDEGGEATPGTEDEPGTYKSGSDPSSNPPADQRKFIININNKGDHEVILPFDANTGDLIAKSIKDTVFTFGTDECYEMFVCQYLEEDGSHYYLLTSGTIGTDSSVIVKPSEAKTIELPEGQHHFNIEINDDGPHLVRLNGPLMGGYAIAEAITSFVTTNIIPKRSRNSDAFEDFICSLEGDPSLLLKSGTKGVDSSVHVTNAPGENIAPLLKLGLTNGGKEINGSAVLRPANSKLPTEYHLGDAVVCGNVDSVILGTDGNTPDDPDYINSVRAGSSPLDIIRDVNILCIPGIGSRDVVSEATNYCTQRKDCFFIGDINQLDDTVEEVRAFIDRLTFKSSYGAVYFPWLKMVDPSRKSPQLLSVPPSGFVAGKYAQIDAQRGVWKAPAGTEASIGGSVGLDIYATDEQQDFLNPIGVNVVRMFPASGIVIWGCRTLATQSDPEYRYVPIRRTAIFLEQSIYNGIQWAVFEPNDEDLWASLRLNVGSFMMRLFRQGAFQGNTPSKAFFVKCDAETTTQADIDAGVVNVLVGFAPLKPAEFVVVKISQKAGQSAV